MEKKIKKEKAKLKKTKARKRKAVDVYQAMDLLDEQQIVNDINGRVPDAAAKMVYSFFDKQTGREITGLSWYGSKAAEREFNRRKLTQISITDKALITQGQGYVDIGVYAYDAKSKMGAWGFSRGYETGRRKDGSTYEDRFPSAKAASKAQRNAVNNLLPAEKVAKMIQSWIRKGQVQQIETPREQAPAKPELARTQWLEKLKDDLRKRGAKTEKEGIAVIRRETGLMIKDFKITDKHAQIIYIALINPKK